MTTPADQQQIRLLAYTIWEAEGRPEGRHLEHWQAAQVHLHPAEPSATEGTLPQEEAGIDRDSSGALERAPVSASDDTFHSISGFAKPAT